MPTNLLFTLTPSLDDPAKIRVPDHPLRGIPELKLPVQGGKIPTDAECAALWDKYDMLDNIRAHSRVVARIATAIAKNAARKGFPVNPDEVRACGLLHDLAKTFCLRHGGGHAQMGAAWVLHETGNRAIAQGVFHHVYWPWELPVDDGQRMVTLPLIGLYADKRVRHDNFVTLQERFSDLYDRYGDTEEHKAGIYDSYLQVKTIEDALSKHLRVGLAHTIPVSD